jgi:hypothetical protein
VTKVADAGGQPAPAPTTTASRPVTDIGHTTRGDASALVLEVIEP